LKPIDQPVFRFHPKFLECLSGIVDPIAKSAIQKKLTKVLEDPKHFTAPLKYPLAGDREIRVLQDLRIIVTLCWECVETGHQNKHDCPCDSIPKNTIICWWVGNHKEMRRAQGITSLPWGKEKRNAPC